jgi:glycosyltransferase involved in cell wall biosynthesis
MKILITIPCYNESIVIEKTTFSVLKYAEDHLQDDEWQLLLLDNNSKDTTWQIIQDLEKKYPGKVIIDQVKTAGRGAALRESWARHPDFDVYTYMDADLSTDIKDFSFIISKVKEGTDIVVGSRYVPTADVKRTLHRKILSRIYNNAIQMFLHVSFQDAQCGFKAMSKRLVHEIVPLTKDNGWFWDTELMIIALRKHYTLLEVPVTWREVRDEIRRSTVSITNEIWRNIRNIYVMRQRLKNNTYGS